MRITIRLWGEGECVLPVHYNHIVQAFIYESLGELRERWHDEGFVLGKRRFKPFTFSRLMGKCKLENDKIRFQYPIELKISSPMVEFMEELACNLARRPEFRLGGNQVVVEAINVEFMPEIHGEERIRMISPMTMYSTVKTVDGRRKTYYYSPVEKEFAKLIGENLVKKYRALYGEEPENVTFHIEPIGFKSGWLKIIKYKGTVIKGWMGDYRVDGAQELIKLAYEAGLGAKTAQGFGMFEIVRGESKL